jgi:hypothetical protein
MTPTDHRSNNMEDLTSLSLRDISRW